MKEYLEDFVREHRPKVGEHTVVVTRGVIAAFHDIDRSGAGLELDGEPCRLVSSINECWVEGGHDLDDVPAWRVRFTCRLSP